MLFTINNVIYNKINFALYDVHNILVSAQNNAHKFVLNETIRPFRPRYAHPGKEATLLCTIA